jgi:hypothetical protein
MDRLLSVYVRKIGKYANRALPAFTKKFPEWKTLVIIDLLKSSSRTQPFSSRPNGLIYSREKPSLFSPILNESTGLKGIPVKESRSTKIRTPPNRPERCGFCEKRIQRETASGSWPKLLQPSQRLRVPDRLNPIIWPELEVK